MPAASSSKRPPAAAPHLWPILLGATSPSSAIISTTALAAASPYAPVTKHAVPSAPSHSRNEEGASSSPSSVVPVVVVLRRTSVEYTAGILHFLTRAFFRFPPLPPVPGMGTLGNPCLCLSSLRHLMSSRSSVTFVRSSTTIFVGSVLPAAPPQVTTGTPRPTHVRISAAFSCIPSMASTQAVNCGPHPPTRSSAFLDVTKSCTSVTSQRGLMSSNLLLVSSIFILPTAELVAWSCRLVFEMQMSSRSTSMRFPTPLRQRDSAAQDPTPPSPITATVAAESRSRTTSGVIAASMPAYSLPTPPNLSPRSTRSASSPLDAPFDASASADGAVVPAASALPAVGRRARPKPFRSRRASPCSRIGRPPTATTTADGGTKAEGE
mmetsp:Transcript_34541/g.73578  ORF Transcript_34541/g.73578 Transcript_34541/m.73578 type:complete len:380 (-) Transcript_34541:359-1498(-)